MKVNPISFKQSYSAIQSNQAPSKSSDKTLNFSRGEKVYAGLSAAGIIGLTVLAAVQKKKINALKNLQSNKISQNAVSEQVKNLLPYEIEKLSENKLYQQFSKTRDSFINFLKNTNADAKNIKSFLFSVTANDKEGINFVKEMTSNPRQSIENLKLLNEKIGGEKNLLEWLQAPDGYNTAFAKYVETIAKNNTSTVDDFLKIAPTWHLYILNERFGRNGNLTIGKLPQEFNELYDYSHFVNWVNNLDFGGKEHGLFEYSGKIMEIKQLKAGMSGKNHFVIQFNPQQNSKKYVLKVQQSWGCDSSYAKENLCYKSDSVFMNAQMDYYLTLHNCENIPKFHYFDYNSNSGLYDFQDGNSVNALGNIFIANNKLNDMNRLGIYYNDASQSNFIEEGGILKVIDIGDSSFIDALRPGAKKYSLQTPNWCGVGLPNLSMMHKQV